MPNVKVMLAVHAELDRLKYPLYASPKLDGIRAIVLDGKVWSRKMLEIPNRRVQETFGRPELEGFDGELIVGNPVDASVFTRTESVTSRATDTTEVHFYVFDKYGPDLRSQPFSDRLVLLEQAFSSGALPPQAKLVPQRLVHTRDELDVVEDTCVKMGFEGVMVRKPIGPYKHGRSTVNEGWLLKIKRTEYSEALVVGFREEQFNGNAAEVDALGHTKRSTAKSGKKGKDRLGALLVKDLYTGIEHKVGTGFTAAQRDEFWKQRDSLIGRVVRYSFGPAVKDKPRFPAFEGFTLLTDLSPDRKIVVPLP